MFTKKSKRNYRMAVWSTVVVCLCILIIYFAWPEKPQENAGSGMNPDYNPSAAASSKSSSSGASIDKYLDDEGDSDDEEKDIQWEDESSSSGKLSEFEENSIIEPQEPYYLVKRVGTEIAVFFCDAKGNMVQLETTEILYEMLGPEDQNLFDQGIRINSQEELSILLQDFEG